MKGFNPCQGNLPCFAPIEDENGQCVPSLYAGETLEAAVFETIFHDVPAKAKRKRVPGNRVEDRAQGRLEVARNLTLVSLREPDLKRWHIKRSQLISATPKSYAYTAEWVEAIHFQFPDVEGLEWTSNQFDPVTVYLFLEIACNREISILYIPGTG